MERKAEYCLTQIFHYLVNGLAAIVFFCCIAYSGYALWDNWSILKEPDQVREDLIRYKPANEEELSYSFQELKAMNPDVCGWLTLDHTKIDYPVVQGTDNFEYLEKDVLGNPSVAGSIFLDKDNSPDFTNRKTILYGHNMKDGSMFQGLHKYESESYLQEHNKVYLYLPDGEALTYTVIKCGYVKADSDTFWLGEQVETRTLLLSTCGSDSSKRLVLFCELPEKGEESETNGEDISIEVL